MAVHTPLTWSVVIPVKVLAQAKSRLAELADADRRALALAMAVDTVAAAVACRLVGAVVVAASELTAALSAAAAVPQSFVADAAGTGTTLYTASPGVPFSPRFGPGSRSLHQGAGASELDLTGIAGLRQDVDTVADLRSAAVIGLGRRSAASAALVMADRV
jgi:2-phospho-L-lactate guanylyltransferase